MSHDRYIRIDKLQADSKLSIEEVGDSNDYIPERDNQAEDKKENQGNHFLVNFTDAKQQQKPSQDYRAYLLNATTEEEFAKILHNLIQHEKSLYNGIQVSFLSASENDNDHYRIMVKCDKCAHCKFFIMVDENKCIYQCNSKEFLPIEELLASECKQCGTAPDTRLNSFKSCFKFNLTCQSSSLRTPTEAKICLKTSDSAGNVVWKDERSFAVCFHNMDDTIKDEQIFKKNLDTIMTKMEGEERVIEILTRHFDFEMDNLPREELIGKLVRHLIASHKGLPLFIDALRETQLHGNGELADILYKDSKNS